MSAARGLVAALVLGAALARIAAAPLELVDASGAGLPVVLAAGADPTERTAAQQLVTYLGRIVGRPFRLVEEAPGRNVPHPAIHVGITARARALGANAAALAPEAWIVRAGDGDVLLYGGSPRGTLYAVEHLLEDDLGVRWWTPWEEAVPRRARPALAAAQRSGRPAFGHRDVFGLLRAPWWGAHNRLNGQYSGPGPRWGGSERFGPPRPVHTFYDYVSPERWFDAHPEFFSERGGFRYGGRGQLCLTNAALVDLVVRRMRGYIAEGREEARRRGVEPPTLYDFSPNDWGGACGCAACSRLEAAEGSAAAPLVAFVNAVAERIAASDPGIRIATLAYLHTLDPPRRLRLHDNVVLRFAALQRRDLAHALADPHNRGVLEALEGWRRAAPHLWIWDYLVTYGDDGALPLPNLRAVARDLRLYRGLGVEGVFVQHDFPIVSDLRDLKSWILAKLLETPERDYDALLVEFTDGYYGAAGPELRRYLRLLERAVARRDARIAFDAGPEAWGWLDGGVLRRAQRLFERAARRVADDPVLSRRVRHARMSLDRATLLPSRAGAVEPAVARAALSRLRRSWLEQIDLRRVGPDRAEARAAAEAELDRLARAR